MPELPEVESVRQGLEAAVRGARITDVAVFRESCVRRTEGGPRHFSADTVGRDIAAVARRGKFLWCELDDGALSAHLGMSGQFRINDPASDPHRHCRARLILDRPGERVALDFVDQRTFGYLDVEPLVPTPDGALGGCGGTLDAVPASVAHIARDLLDPALDTQALFRTWCIGRRGIKQVLLDQTRVSGLGNIYADEALWRARIHPTTPADSLPVTSARRLFRAAVEVVSASLAAGGTSFDALYVNVNGDSGYFSRDLNAYGQTGTPCARCGTPIRRAVVMARSTHWCPRCQRARRVPAAR